MATISRCKESKQTVFVFFQKAPSAVCHYLYFLQVIAEQSDSDAPAAKIPSFFPPGPLPPNIPPPPFLPPPPSVSAAPPLIPPPSKLHSICSILVFLVVFGVFIYFFLGCRITYNCPSSWISSSTHWTTSCYHPYHGQVTDIKSDNRSLVWINIRI